MNRYFIEKEEGVTRLVIEATEEEWIRLYETLNGILNEDWWPDFAEDTIATLKDTVEECL